MGFGLLFIPILGGYLFIRTCHWQRFTGSRASGYHLLFRSAIAGAFLLLIAWILTLFEPYVQDWWPVRIWPSVRPFPYAWTLASTLAIGLVAARVVNLFYDEDSAAFNAVWAGNDAMERLLFEAAIYDGWLVEVTLCNGKVYAGWVLGATAVRDRKYVEIMPVASGYRSPQTLRIHFTTNYAEVIDFEEIEWNDYRVVIPMSEIRTARPFKLEVYEKFQRKTDTP